jgi:hypothetical protein
MSGVDSDRRHQATVPAPGSWPDFGAFFDVGPDEVITPQTSPMVEGIKALIEELSTTSAPTVPVKRRRKHESKGTIRRRASALFEADLASGGKTELLDPEAEMWKEDFHPIDGFPDMDPPVDLRDEMEDRQQRGERALESVRQMKESVRRASRRPLMAAQSGVVEEERTEAVSEYELPDGEARLDWDTDRVRRLFGKVE